MFENNCNCSHSLLHDKAFLTFFTHKANKDFNYAKERVCQVDEENLVFSYNHVEGGVLGTKLALANHELKISPKEGGGSIVSFIVNYERFPSVPLDEAKLEEFKANYTGLFRLLEGYLIANPTLYLL